MNDSKNQQQQNQQSGEQNPTLNTPGTQVADYGNPTGGSGQNDGDGQQNRGQQGQANSSRAADSNETMGNP